MEINYCVGLCPLCQGNGHLIVVKDERGVFVTCEECYKEFRNPQDALINKALSNSTFNDIPIGIEEVIEQGWADYIYIYEDGRWLNYVDRTKNMLDAYPEVKKQIELEQSNKRVK